MGWVLLVVADDAQFAFRVGNLEAFDHDSLVDGDGVDPAVDRADEHVSLGGIIRLGTWRQFSLRAAGLRIAMEGTGKRLAHALMEPHRAEIEMQD